MASSAHGSIGMRQRNHEPFIAISTSQWPSDTRRGPPSVFPFPHIRRRRVRRRCASGALVRSSGSGHTDGENPGIAHHTYRSGKAIKKGAGTRRVREILFDRSGARASWRIAGIHLSFWRTAVALASPGTSESGTGMPRLQRAQIWAIPNRQEGDAKVRCSAG